MPISPTPSANRFRRQQHVQVKPLKRFLFSGRRKYRGETGVVGFVEQGPHSSQALYTVIFPQRENATECFFADELQPVPTSS